MNERVTLLQLISVQAIQDAVITCENRSRILEILQINSEGKSLSLNCFLFIYDNIFPKIYVNLFA